MALGALGNAKHVPQLVSRAIFHEGLYNALVPLQATFTKLLFHDIVLGFTYIHIYIYVYMHIVILLISMPTSFLRSLVHSLTDSPA